MPHPIAFLVSSDMLPGSPAPRGDAFELQLELAELSPACAARGLPLEVVVWNDPGLKWDRFAAAVIGTPWDYASQKERFLQTLEEIESRIPLFNPSEVVRWNIDKRYLQELERQGAPSIPTLWLDGVEGLDAAFDSLDTNEIVVKPQVGAGGYHVLRLRRGDPLPGALPAGPCMVQPFLPAIETWGELSLVLYDGQVSHAVRKVPAEGDFRVQALWGAKEHAHEATPAETAAALAVYEAATAALGRRLLYGRVDMAPGLDGRLVVMELELIEPYHYPEQGPGCGERFARALERFLP